MSKSVEIQLNNPYIIWSCCSYVTDQGSINHQLLKMCTQTNFRKNGRRCPGLPYFLKPCPNHLIFAVFSSSLCSHYFCSLSLLSPVLTPSSWFFLSSLSHSSFSPSSHAPVLAPLSSSFQRQLTSLSASGSTADNSRPLPARRSALADSSAELCRHRIVGAEERLPARHYR